MIKTKIKTRLTQEMIITQILRLFLMGFLGYFKAFRLKGARTGLEFKAKIKTLST
ncbi:hypothetical protein I4634_001611 [Campylobacter upsaliensis]|nr:hypothetical protein [Campylobacter upsaliensis]